MSNKTKLLNFLKGNKDKAAASTEPAKEKTLSDLQQEYSNVCARIGDAEYQIFLKQEEVKLLKDTARKINQEGAEVQARTVQVAAEQAAPAAQEESEGT